MSSAAMEEVRAMEVEVVAAEVSRGISRRFSACSYPVFYPCSVSSCFYVWVRISTAYSRFILKFNHEIMDNDNDSSDE